MATACGAAREAAQQGNVLQAKPVEYLQGQVGLVAREIKSDDTAHPGKQLVSARELERIRIGQEDQWLPVTRLQHSHRDTTSFND